MAVTVTCTELTAMNTAVEKTFNPATSSTIDQAEVFTVTPKKADYKTVVEIYNGTGHGAITATVAKGNLPAGAAADKVLTVAAGKTAVVELEGGRYFTDGSYKITLTPATGKRLATDHAAGMSCIGTL